MRGRQTEENQRDKKGKMFLLFNKAGKGCVLDKCRIKAGR